MKQPRIALPTALKDGIDRIRIELGDIQRFLAARRDETRQREFRFHIAAAQFEAALARYAAASQKAGFCEDQPRWPKYTSDGGQWSGGAGSKPGRRRTTTELSAVRRKPPLRDLPIHLPHFSPGTSGATTPRVPITIDNNAQTGISTVDETTEKLRKVLEQVINSRPEGFGPEYGTQIHYDFANVVKAENLRGIGRTGVEQTFGPDPDNRSVPYGSKGSVRTDVVLRNDIGDVIAIYDVKTGSAKLGPLRVQELREKTDASPRIPIIEMHIQRGLSLKARTGHGYSWIITLRLWNPWVRAMSDRQAGEKPADDNSARNP